MKLFRNAKLNTKFTLLIILLVALPIGIMGGIIFYNMEENVVKENVNYTVYNVIRSREDMETKLTSVNMVTQYFLSDASLREVLRDAADHKQLSTQELREIYMEDISDLERLVNNNPVLYGVRVYSSSDDLQEMVPILYRHERSLHQPWSNLEAEEGWHLNYEDRIFTSNKSVKPTGRIASRVTAIADHEKGTIATIEACISMRDLFPSLYENLENESACFLTKSGTLISETTMEEELKSQIEEKFGSLEKSEEVHTFYQKGKTNLILSGIYIDELEGYLIRVADITGTVKNVYNMRNIFVVTMLVFIVLLAFAVSFMVKVLLSHFYEILGSIRSIQKGDMTVRIAHTTGDEMGELGHQINKMMDRIQNLMEENLRRELLAKNSEIRSLQNQINAHFIYNVLESIKMMAEMEEQYEISDAITSLGKLLRYSMKWRSGNVLLKEELEYIRNYLALINLRFDYEIYLSENIPEELMNQRIPKMSLQPIVENAIYHGIEQIAEDTTIYIKGILQDKTCCLEISDMGRGMSEEKLAELQEKLQMKDSYGEDSEHGIGLKNVQDRIHMAFGDAYGLSVSSKEGLYTKVSLTLPLETAANSNG
ncbi:MAG: sensor histidine kinase [Lachnospiraceae bacterium]|nr:sensor histidine kinase [Lachnospiraceae bacterium]